MPTAATTRRAFFFAAAGNLSYFLPRSESCLATKKGSRLYLPRFVVPVGSSAQFDVIPLAANRVFVQFSQPMQLSGANKLGQDSLWMSSIGDANTPVHVLADSFAWNPKTNTASWQLESSVDDGDYAGRIYGLYKIHVAGTILDRYGHALDGNWVDYNYTASGNGTAGGEFVFTVMILPGDIDGNGYVDFTDLGILLNNYDLPGTFAMGDLNGDGVIDFTDFGILDNWWHWGEDPNA